MKAEIISTGKEILSGDIIDTNSALIASKLKECGIETLYHHCTGDNEKELALIIKEASKRSPIIFVTGGLGPTEDDKTRNAVSNLLGVKQILNNDALESVKKFFSLRKIPMPDENIVQAMLPEGAIPVINEYGTAPGFYFELNSSRIYCLPGVPYELEKILDFLIEDNLVSYIKTNPDFIYKYFLSEKISLFGLPESKAGKMLETFIKKEISPEKDIVLEFGIQAVFPHIFIKIYSKGTVLEELQNEIKKVKEKIRAFFDKYFISGSGKTLAEKVSYLLKQKKLTLSVAESCTGGLIGTMLTDIPGSSEIFNLSAVTYSNNAKINILGVSPQTIKEFGAVSENTAYELADGVRIKGLSDFGLSTTGIAGPSGGVPGKETGTVCIGVSNSFSTKTYRFERDFKDRLLNKKLFAALALKVLADELENYGDN